MRKYESIWLKLKSEGKCLVAAHPALHKRIKKAVTKEKYRDVKFKVEYDLADRLQPELSVTVDSKQPNVLIFMLIIPVSLGDL